MHHVFRHLDTRGKVCPLPVLLTVREMLRLEIGDRLEVVGDDPAMREDLSVWCERSGHRIIERSETGGEIRFVFEKVTPL